MAKLNITQARGLVKATTKQRRTMEALGLRRIHHTVTHEDTPTIRGMIDRVRHLVRVEEVKK